MDTRVGRDMPMTWAASSWRMFAFSRAIRRRRPISCALSSFRSAIASSIHPALQKALISLRGQKCPPFLGMRYQHRPQFLQSFLVAFRYRGRDLRGVNANVVVRQAAHVREMLQVARTDASVLDHDVPISLLGYYRQSIGRVRCGKVGHDISTRRLIDASGMQAEA